MGDDPRYSQQHVSPMGSRGKSMQGLHQQNIHPGIAGTGQQGMQMPSQGPGMTGMSPGHQMMQGGPGPNMGPGGPSSSMGSSQNMPVGAMGGHGLVPGGMTTHGMSMNSSSNMPPTSMGGMPDSNLGNMPSSGGGMSMPNHSQQQSSMGLGQMVGPGSVQGLPPAISGGSSSPSLSGSQMAGGAMGPPNQSVDPSTSQSKCWENSYLLLIVSEFNYPNIDPSTSHSLIILVLV